MTLYFYDLETSGLDPRFQRIMQFGGQRTDADLNLIGQPDEIFVRLSDDVLPEPDAVMVTGITPQQTIDDGISESAFLRQLNNEVFTKDTIVAGFNNIRFDDEFIRYSLYRNYFDPYAREWAEGRGRWDVIDLVRITRALRPDGINWPLTPDGKATNRLEELTKANGIEHSNAHSALADVMATIEIAKLIKQKQPKIYEHMFAMKNKKNVLDILAVGSGRPVVHSSGRLKSENLSTSVFLPLVAHPVNNNAILAWDLRYDPAPWQNTTAEEIARLAFTPWRELAANDESRVPIKAIHINKSPAVAPLGVLDEASQERINLNINQIQAHLSAKEAISKLTQSVQKAWQRESNFEVIDDPDAQLYDSFLPDQDRMTMLKVHTMTEEQLRSSTPEFSDIRLKNLWLRFKARNNLNTLTDEERATWEQFRAKKLKSGPGMTISKYMSRLKQLAEDNQTDKQKLYLLEELQLYAESIIPYENENLF